METEARIYTTNKFIVNDKFISIDCDVYRLKYINYVNQKDDDDFYTFEFGYNDGSNAFTVVVRIETNPVKMIDFLEFSATENLGFITWKNLEDWPMTIDNNNDEAVMSEALSIVVAGHNNEDAAELKDRFISEYHKWLHRNEKENKKIFDKYFDDYNRFIDTLIQD